ncbi:MAG: chromosome segregation protein SMC [Burkholderiales bacterium]|nr:chromosome segregation protein SMC [Burkholderiales bacterium]
MRLTQIRLSGFKSFVDPTVIHLPGNLVGVVGPNGCGKSNVIDAVRWVLGEMRAAALRGDSMQDVIFNGAANRQPLARAAVELLFDNSLGRIGGPWSRYAEISVKRVIQRDGESSYFINGTPVRRRDITDMFLGTGLGPRAYAIIEQGMISRVIEARPEELRVFLEEAAGVSRYRERRKETERRLADTRENLARVTDIRAELGAQIEKLEAQAKVAARYRELQQELRVKQQLLWYLRRRDAAAERARHAEAIARTEAALEAETAQLRALEGRLAQARSAHDEAAERLNAAQAALYGANAEVARHEAELRHAEAARESLAARRRERRAQLDSAREQRAQLTQSLHAWVARHAERRDAAARTAEASAAETARLPQAERAYRAAQEQLAAARAALAREEGAAQLEEQAAVHLRRALESLEARRARLQAELAELVEPPADAIAESEARIAALGAAIAEAQRALEQAHEEAAAAEAAKAQAARALEQAVRAHAAAAAQRDTLVQVQAQAEANAPLAEWLERKGLAALPRLWQRIRIEPGWETAVESVLRERLHALEAGEAAALRALGDEAPPVKASFYAPSDLPAPVPPAASLAAKVHCADAALAHAVGEWLAGAIVCEGRPDASALAALAPGAFYVDRAGHRYTAHTLALHAPDAADAGMLARQAEIDALEGRVAELARAAQAARAHLAACDAALAERLAALEHARARIAEHERERHASEIAALTLRQARERWRERSAQIQRELGEIAEAQAADEARLAAAGAALARLAANIAGARDALAEAQAAYDAAAAALAEQRERAASAERAAQEARFAEREAAAKIGELDGAVKLIDAQIDAAEREAARLDAELARDPIPALRDALAAAVEARLAREQSLAEARATLEAAASALRALDEERLRRQAACAPLRESLEELRLKEQAARLSLEQFAAQLAESGADEAQLAQAEAGAPRPASLQTEIARAAQALADLGAVNLAALEELAAARERKQFLDAQSADLEEAAKTLEDAIRRIDRETRELLRETFDAVNGHFGTLFPQLFGGGEARLVLTGEEILDAGVQVVAQPPGKRNSTIHLLSGGEKALTAIALVFALFQLNPAPFCLLDEVDAPLDDANTLRFCELVKRMSAQTQFLFITHNKITMEMASHLIGVTMPESGVSRVVAVDVAEALRMREELAA